MFGVYLPGATEPLFMGDWNSAVAEAKKFPSKGPMIRRVSGRENAHRELAIQAAKPAPAVAGYTGKQRVLDANDRHQLFWCWVDYASSWPSPAVQERLIRAAENPRCDDLEALKVVAAWKAGMVDRSGSQHRLAWTRAVEDYTAKFGFAPSPIIEEEVKANLAVRGNCHGANAAYLVQRYHYHQKHQPVPRATAAEISAKMGWTPAKGAMSSESASS